MRRVIDSLVKKDTRRIIGLMSGTSADGVDAALIEIQGSGDTMNWELLAAETTPFAPADRAEILALQRPDPGPGLLGRVARLHFRLGDIYAAACEAVATKAGFPISEIDMAGLHGQTVFHATRPAASTVADASASGPGPAASGTSSSSAIPSQPSQFIPATLQIGEAHVLAERTGLSVVYDFRARDVAAGGTGAPLVPYVDYLLFRSPDEGRLCLNLGGIANITAFPPSPNPADVIAFDTGPGNMVIDALSERFSDGAERYDKGGARAAMAPPDAELLRELMANEFVLAPPPKSAGREEFGQAFIEQFVKRALERKLSRAAALSTATSFTVRSIVEAYRLYVLSAIVIDEVLVSGGGVHNRTLMDRLAAEMNPIPVRSTQHYGLDPDAKEAVAFAILANESIHGQPANLPGVTGAAHPVVLGSFVPGRIVT